MIKKFFVAVTLLGMAAATTAHDPGISNMTLCNHDAELRLSWELAADERAARLVASRGGRVLPPLRRGRSKAGHHGVLYWWIFGDGSSPEKIELIGLAHLPFGHRVVAQDCRRGDTEDVLSERNPVWWIPSASGGPHGRGPG